MTNEIPYSNVISKEKALAEIKSCAGNQFDPELDKNLQSLKLLVNKSPEFMI